MALSDVTFSKSPGGLGRPLTGEDHISGFIMWFTNANLPSGFSTSDRIKLVFSLSQAETLGIAEGSATTGVMWYQVSEYFRQQPKGELYIGCYGDITGTVDFSDIETLQTFANGKIRQIGVFDDQNAFATANCTSLQTSVNTLFDDHMPVQILYTADFTGVTLAALVDLTTLTAKNVSVILAQDGSAAGAALAVSESNSIPAIGAVLGLLSKSKVSEHIGHVEKYNVSNGVELDEPAFANGVLVKDEPTSSLVSIDNKGYIFMRKRVGDVGTYVEDTPTAIVETNSFSVIELNRVCDKAVRDAYVFLLPNVNSQLFLNDDGTLTEETIARFKNDADRALEQMVINGELSGGQSLIDPTQNVLSTSNLEISLELLPVGIARSISVRLGFVLSLS